MMRTLREFLQIQIENINRLNDETKLMVINKEDLTIVSTITKKDLAESLQTITDVYLDKGLLSAIPNKGLGCVIVTITDIPETDKPMVI